FWVAQKVSVVTVPVLLAILFAYLFEPVIDWLTRKTSLKRTGAVVAVIATTLCLVVVPSVLGLTYGVVQGVDLAGRVAENTGTVIEYIEAEPDDAESIGARLEEAGPAWVWIGEHASEQKDGGLARIIDMVYAWAEANAERIATAGLGVMQTALTFFASAFSLLFMAFLTVFFFFFFSTGWVNFKGFTGKLLPDKYRAQIVDLATKFDKVISAFIRGRLTIAFIQAVVFTLGFWIVGVPAAFILGPVVALLSIVPYLALIGLPIAVTLLWLENNTGIRGHPIYIVAAPVAFYFFAQALDDYVWTPLIQGKETGMSTPMILFASVAGGVLFGVFGLLIAIPIAACIKILVEEIFWPRFKDWAEGRASDMLPIDES
ncbi:MAG: AI-2E family transporter, partial [Phycisphaerales bacterium JB059]